MHKFYNAGKVYEISKGQFQWEGSTDTGHQDGTGKVILDQGAYGYGFAIEGKTDKLKYYCITVDGVTGTDLTCAVDYNVIENETLVAARKITRPLKNGVNLIPTENNGFNNIGVTFTGSNGSSLSVKKMELREKAPIFTWGKALKYSAIYGGLYILASGLFYLLYRLLRKRFGGWNLYGVVIDTLQGIYQALYDTCKRFFDLKNRAAFRTALFFIMFAYSVVIEMRGAYYEYFKYHMVIYAAILILLICTSLPERCSRKNWNNSLAWAWVTLWVMACASDFFIKNEYRYIGYLMLIVLGCFFFVWSNMKQPEAVIRDFARAIHLLFICIVIFCLLFRPELEGMRYSGLFKNPSIFCLNLGTITVVVLGELEHRFKASEPLRRMLPYLLELCLVLAFCWKSQSATASIAIVVVGAIWLFKMITEANRCDRKKKLLVIIALFLVLMVPTYAGVTAGLKHLPEKLGTTIVYDGEVPVARVTLAEEAYAGELMDKIQQTRLGQKFTSGNLNTILSGREYYYKAYLRSMNLIGHGKRVEAWGRGRQAHNSIIAIAYRYGIFAAVPYLIMLVAAIARTYRYSKRKGAYASIPFYVCLSSILMSLADNVEQPFIWLPWMGLYIMMGICFGEDRMTDHTK